MSLSTHKIMAPSTCHCGKLKDYFNLKANRLELYSNIKKIEKYFFTKTILTIKYLYLTIVL